MNKLYNDTAVQAIANAIRAKNGSSDTYTIAEMSTALNDLSYYAKPTISNVALATFEADGLPLNSLKVSVEAKQAGSGTPSPENVRPISGWSEVNVSDCGKNKCDISGYTTKTINGMTYTNNGDGTISLNGTSTTSNWEVLTEVVLKAGTYILSGCPLNGSHTTYHLAIQGDGVSWSQNEDTGNGVTVTIPNDGTFNIIFRIANSGISFNNTLLKPMIRLASVTDPTFEPYINQTTTISLPQTVYGGEVDVVNGILKITDGYIASYNGETLPSTWISSMDVYAEGTTPTTGAEVCYELANPIIINLTPTLIKSLDGQNNLSVDCGEVIELEYFKEV